MLGAPIPPVLTFILQSSSPCAAFSGGTLPYALHVQPVLAAHACCAGQEPSSRASLTYFESRFPDLLLRFFPHKVTLLSEVTTIDRFLSCENKGALYMKEISRRSFLRTSALAGAAAVLAGAAPLAAGAASPAAVPEENCLDSLGTAVASLGNGTPVLPSVVGLSRGSIMGYCENGIYTFKGIPYGTHQRFKYAAPVEQYGTPDQPTNALTNGSVSPQSNTQTEYYNPFAAAAFMTPSESDLFSTESQCLNLNVWTDTLNSSAQKPVLVFIHGGGLQTGAALELKIYDGKYFADYTDCVFVSTNARLNYVGYMDLSAIGGDANVGIADLVLALQWVRDNIAAFGGDPNNVTILGQSGGGTKVTALASAPAAQGLFQKVANVSGGSASGRSPELAAQNAYKLADYVRTHVDGMAAASDSEVFRYLQTVRYDNLVDLCEGAGADYQLTTGSPYFQQDFYSGSGLNPIAAQYTYLIGSV